MGDNTELSREEREEIFRESIASDSNRQAFAESWGAMINTVLPVETSVRNIFTVETIPAGSVPVYTNDVRPISAWYLPKYGQAPQNIVEIDEVTVPTFELVGSVEYKMRDAKHARISIAERSLQRLKDSMIQQEEDAGWAVIGAAVTSANTVDGSVASLSGYPGLSKQVVDAAFELMETNRLHKVTDIYVGPGAMADIRGWTQTTIDPVTQREIFVNAGMPSIYGAQIHIVHFLAANEAYFFDLQKGVPHELGYMPIRDELRTFDDPTALSKFRIRTNAYEEIGFVIMDSTCIVKASLT